MTAEASTSDDLIARIRSYLTTVWVGDPEPPIPADDLTDEEIAGMVLALLEHAERAEYLGGLLPGPLRRNGGVAGAALRRGDPVVLGHDRRFYPGNAGRMNRMVAGVVEADTPEGGRPRVLSAGMFRFRAGADGWGVVQAETTEPPEPIRVGVARENLTIRADRTVAGRDINDVLMSHNAMMLDWGAIRAEPPPLRVEVDREDLTARVGVDSAHSATLEFGTPQDPETHHTLDMDGTEHEIPGRDRCFCRTSGKDCPDCGSYMHYQPVHGGYFYRCEDCGDRDP